LTGADGFHVKKNDERGGTREVDDFGTLFADEKEERRLLSLITN
jgi:hypothetical protein